MNTKLILFAIWVVLMLIYLLGDVLRKKTKGLYLAKLAAAALAVA